jgi:tetratricopeptide (TPR) repeat protein
LLRSIDARIDLIRKTEDITKRRDLRTTIISDYSTLSVVYLDFGDIERATNYIDKAFKLYNEFRKPNCKTHPDWPLIYMYRNRGDILLARYHRNTMDKANHFEETKKDYEESFECASALNDTEGKGVAKTKLGDLFYSQGDKYAGYHEDANAKRSYDAAEVKYTEGHKFLETLGGTIEKARWHSVLGRIYRSRNDFRDALKNYTESRELYEGKGKSNIADQYHYLSELYREQGIFDTACKHGKMAADKYDAIGMNWKSSREKDLLRRNQCLNNGA